MAKKTTKTRKQRSKKQRKKQTNGLVEVEEVVAVVDKEELESTPAKIVPTEVHLSQLFQRQLDAAEV